MEAWFTSNLILTAIVAPAVSYLAINSVYEIASWDRMLNAFVKNSLPAITQVANDLTYDIKVQAWEAEAAKQAANGASANP
ncbi:MAG: hypothetical protein HC768_22065 [Acaryochloris sp. CRU_2_0]|nr:hypothetical protein [Acaryochloris sp. CRU_2_0]